MASDFDGTLTGADGVVPARVRAALARLDAAGIPLVLVTGRCIGALPPMLAQVPVRTPVVGANGAVIVDPVTGGVLSRRAIPAATLATVVPRLRAALPGVFFAVERGPDFLHEPGYPAPVHVRRSRHVVPPTELVAAPADKLAVRRSDPPSEDGHLAVAAIVAGVLEATYSGIPGLVELSLAGVTKASGLAEVAGLLGVAAADVLAFGDMPNDLPMLRWAGRGLCVDGAHPALRAAIESCGPDGVAGLLDDVVNSGIRAPERRRTEY